MKLKINKVINLLNLINKFFFESLVLRTNQNILIAFSGGQDSISILIIFFIFKKQWNLEIMISYCHHLCQKETFFSFLHLSKISFTLRIHLSYSTTHELLISEQKARNWRLKVYQRILYFLNYNAIITGHTKTDQIETFIFNLFRGAGLKGAYSLNLKKNLNFKNKHNFIISKRNLSKLEKKDIFFKKKIFFQKKKNYVSKKIFFLKHNSFKKYMILRPLLKLSRFDTQLISKKLKLPTLPDKTNQKNFYTRNRIRKQLLPTLRFFFNPQIDSSLVKYNKILIDKEKIVEKILNNILLEIITENKNFFCLNINIFFNFPLDIQIKFLAIFFENKFLIIIKFNLIRNLIKKIKDTYQDINKLKIKDKETNFFSWFFFPKIGILVFYKTTIFFFK